VERSKKSDEKRIYLDGRGEKKRMRNEGKGL
jgi:hypothetical protein